MRRIALILLCLFSVHSFAIAQDTIYIHNDTSFSWYDGDYCDLVTLAKVFSDFDTDWVSNLKDCGYEYTLWGLVFCDSVYIPFSNYNYVDNKERLRFKIFKRFVGFRVEGGTIIGSNWVYDFLEYSDALNFFLDLIRFQHKNKVIIRLPNKE